MKNTIIATPRTLLVVISRYATSGNCINKLHNNIDVNEQLIIETERGNVMHKLKSMDSATEVTVPTLVIILVLLKQAQGLYVMIYIYTIY